MSSTEVTNPSKDAAIERVLIEGDLSVLNEQQRTQYLVRVCESMGLNPLTKPFEYVKLNNKLTLYCTRAGTDQLRKVNRVSIKITERQNHENVYIVTAQATTPDGRYDESTGAVSIGGLRGDALANACMKAETKAKRRVTLSICGLGWLEESEIETIPGAHKVSGEVATTLEKATSVSPPSPHREAPSQLPSQAEGFISFGKFKGRHLQDIPAEELENYMSWLIQKSKDDKKPIDSNGVVGKFLDEAGKYLASFQTELKYEDTDDALDINQ